MKYLLRSSSIIASCLTILCVTGCTSSGKGVNPFKLFNSVPEVTATASPVDFAEGTVDTINSVDMNAITTNKGVRLLRSHARGTFASFVNNGLTQMCSLKGGNVIEREFEDGGKTKWCLSNVDNSALFFWHFRPLEEYPAAEGDSITVGEPLTDASGAEWQASISSDYGYMTDKEYDQYWAGINEKRRLEDLRLQKEREQWYEEHKEEIAQQEAARRAEIQARRAELQRKRDWLLSPQARGLLVCSITSSRVRIGYIEDSANGKIKVLVSHDGPIPSMVFGGFVQHYEWSSPDDWMDKCEFKKSYYY